MIPAVSACSIVHPSRISISLLDPFHPFIPSPINFPIGDFPIRVEFCHQTPVNIISSHIIAVLMNCSNQCLELEGSVTELYFHCECLCYPPCILVSESSHGLLLWRGFSHVTYITLLFSRFSTWSWITIVEGISLRYVRYPVVFSFQYLVMDYYCGGDLLTLCSLPCCFLVSVPGHGLLLWRWFSYVTYVTLLFSRFSTWSWITIVEGISLRYSASMRINYLRRWLSSILLKWCWLFMHYTNWDTYIEISNLTMCS